MNSAILLLLGVRFLYVRARCSTRQPDRVLIPSCDAETTPVSGRYAQKIGWGGQKSRDRTVRAVRIERSPTLRKITLLAPLSENNLYYRILMVPLDPQTTSNMPTCPPNLGPVHTRTHSIGLQVREKIIPKLPKNNTFEALLQ